MKSVVEGTLRTSNYRLPKDCRHPLTLYDPTLTEWDLVARQACKLPNCPNFELFSGLIIADDKPSSSSTQGFQPTKFPCQRDLWAAGFRVVEGRTDTRLPRVATNAPPSPNASSNKNPPRLFWIRQFSALQYRAAVTSAPALYSLCPEIFRLAIKLLRVAPSFWY